MTEITSKPDYGSRIADEQGALAPIFQNFFDELESQLNTNLLGDVLQLQPHTVATVPNASDNKDALIRVTDESTGAMIAISDGIDWRTAAGVIIS